VIVFIPFFIFY
jgi:hypothetical protein